jgi:hypothetical protein
MLVFDVFVYSHFIENPPINLEAIDLSFMRWFCHRLLHNKKPRGLSILERVA